MKIKLINSTSVHAVLITAALCLNIFGTFGTALADESGGASGGSAPTGAPSGSSGSSSGGTGSASATTPPTPTFSVGTYLKTNEQKEFVSVPAYIVRIINILSMAIGSFAFLAIVIGGFMMVTSGGREAAVTRGKDIIKYAIIGLVVALAAFFITSFVQSIFYEYTK